MYETARVRRVIYGDATLTQVVRAIEIIHPQQAIVVERNRKVNRGEVIVRIQPGDGALELSSQYLQQKVRALARSAVSCALREMPLANLLYDEADVIESEYLRGCFLDTVDFAGQCELQPGPIFDALVGNTFEISSAQFAPPNDLVTCHSVGIKRIFGCYAGPLRVLHIYPAL